jgi:hypothetical protein
VFALSQLGCVIRNILNFYIIVSQLVDKSHFLYAANRATSEQEFLAKQGVMARVNEYIKNIFFPNISRSACQELQLSDESRTTIKGIFFDEDGSLKKSIQDVLLKKSGVAKIVFQNGTFANERDDSRWFAKFSPECEGKKDSTCLAIACVVILTEYHVICSYEKNTICIGRGRNY